MASKHQRRCTGLAASITCLFWTWINCCVKLHPFNRFVSSFLSSNFVTWPLPQVAMVTRHFDEIADYFPTVCVARTKRSTMRHYLIVYVFCSRMWHIVDIPKVAEFYLIVCNGKQEKIVDCYLNVFMPASRVGNIWCCTLFLKSEIFLVLTQNCKRLRDFNIRISVGSEVEVGAKPFHLYHCYIKRAAIWKLGLIIHSFLGQSCSTAFSFAFLDSVGNLQSRNNISIEFAT